MKNLIPDASVLCTSGGSKHYSSVCCVSRSNIECDTSTPSPVSKKHIEDCKCNLNANAHSLAENSNNGISSVITGKSEMPPISSLPDINQQYLGDSLKVGLISFESLLVKSPQGTGKTSAVKALLRDDYKVFMMSPRDKLNQALSRELHNFNYYVDIKKAIEQNQSPDLIIPMIERMTCTPQSLPAIADYYEKHTGRKLSYNVMVLDEIEAIAEMLTSNVTRDKTGVLSAFKAVAKNSMVRVGLDAFPTEKSRYLMGLLSPAGEFGALTNNYKRWSNINATILDGGDYSKRSDALQVLQRKALNAGKRIAVTSSSASYCDRVYKNLKTLHPDLKYIMVDREGSPEASALMNNTDLIKNYDVVIYTPTINVGVSFDIQKHVDCVFASFPNAEGTGGTSDALQALARIRHPVDNQWFIALDNDKKLFNVDRQSIPDNDVISILWRRYKQELWGAGVADAPTPEELEVVRLAAVNEGDRVADKNNFNQVFESKLLGMGVSINRLALTDIESDEELKTVAASVKEKIAEAEIQAKTQSERIDERQYSSITMRLKHDKESVTSDERDSLKRFVFESKFNINCDELSDSELNEFLELDDSNAVSKAVNREIAEGQSREFNNRLMKARVVGLGDNGAFKVDLIDERMNYRLKARLLSYAAPYFGGDSYTHKSLKGSGFYKFVERNKQEILVTGVIPLPSEWRKKPALLMNHLIDSCGFKVTMSREVDQLANGNKAKKVQRWRAVSIKGVDTLVADRLARGDNWIQKTSTLMDMFQDMGAYLKPDHIEALQMPRVDIDFVHDQLKLIPSHLKDDVLTEYRARYDMMNPDNCGIDAPIKANEWLLNQVENIGIKSAVLSA